MQFDVIQREDLLTPGAVARVFGVHPKTISRWANAGLLTAVRTAGGHRRYHADEVRALLRRAPQTLHLDPDRDLG